MFGFYVRLSHADDICSLRVTQYSTRSVFRDRTSSSSFLNTSSFGPRDPAELPRFRLVCSLLFTLERKGRICIRQNESLFDRTAFTNHTSSSRWQRPLIPVQDSNDLCVFSPCDSAVVVPYVDGCLSDLVMFCVQSLLTCQVSGAFVLFVAYFVETYCTTRLTPVILDTGPGFHVYVYSKNPMFIVFDKMWRNVVGTNDVQLDE